MRLLAVAFYLVVHLAAFACSDQGVTVTKETVGNTVRIYAASRDGMHVTLEFTAELQNMRSSPALPTTVTIAGPQRRLIAELSQADRRQPWRYNYRYRYYRGHPGGQPADVLYRLPYRAGERYRVGQGNFGKFSHRPGTGDEYAFDFDMPEGTTVCAARGGVVAGVRSDSTAGGPNPTFSNCANFVMIRHDDGTYADYLHLQAGGVRVKVGQRVDAGQPLGLSGNTGWSTRPHLHFVVFRTIDGTKREALPIKFALPGMPGGQVPQQGQFY